MSSIGMAGTCVCSVEKTQDSLSELKKMAASLPQFIGSGKIENVADFCRVNGYRDSLEDQSERPHDPWILNFMAAQDSREKNFKDTINISQALKKIKEGAPPSSDELKICKINIQDLKDDEDNTDAWAKGLAANVASGVLCKDLTLTKIVQCASSMNKLRIELTPIHDIASVGLWSEIISDPVYTRATKDVALKTLDSITKKSTPTTHLFDDVHAAFLKETKDDKKATEYTFKLLGAMSTGGSNAGEVIPLLCDGLSDTSLVTSLRVIAMGSLVLDRMTAKKGFLYSYPKEVSSLCDYCKNYHFWMTAYLAYRAAKENGDALSAATAAFSLDKAYQFAKDGNGRDPSRPFKENAFSNYNNNVRLDLTQSAAGAWYGAMLAMGESKQLSQQQFEDGLRQSFAGSKEIKLDPNFSFPSHDDKVQILSAYLKWKDVINPDAAFKYFQKQMGK